MEDGQDSEIAVDAENYEEECSRYSHYGTVDWMEECDESGEEQNDRNVEKKGDEFHYGVHVESTDTIIEIREYSSTNDGRWAHVGFLDEVPGPLLDQGRDECAREAETETDEPERVACERCGGRPENTGHWELNG